MNPKMTCWKDWSKGEESKSLENAKLDAGEGPTNLADVPSMQVLGVSAEDGKLHKPVPALPPARGMSPATGEVDK